MNVTVLAAIFARVIETSRFSRTVLVIKVRRQNITCIPISRPSPTQQLGVSADTNLVPLFRLQLTHAAVALHARLC